MTDRDMRNIEALANGHFRVRIEHEKTMIAHTLATYEEALDLRDEIKRQIVDGSLKPKHRSTAHALRAAFLGSRNSNRSCDDDVGRWDNHIGTAPWAQKRVATVTRADGRAWLKALKRKHVCFDPVKQGDREKKCLGWQTRKHCLGLARAFFGWAIDEEIYGITENPFVGLVVNKEDGDEDDGYQDGWYLDATEQPRFFAMWDLKDADLDAGDRMEKWIAMFAAGSGLRRGEQWCLHLADLHVGINESAPRVDVVYGSWDSTKRRYRAPKGRKGEKKKRTVFLHGLALDAARAWLKILPIYAPKNPLGLVFPTERGSRRTANPRSWTKIVDAFDVIPRIGRKVWWHLLRHTCASSLISGWWGMRWSLEDVSKVLGHTDVRTTQIYAHLAPSAIQATAMRAQAAFFGCQAGASAQRPAARKPTESKGHARQESDLRHPASKAGNSNGQDDGSSRLGRAKAAICHILELIRDEECNVELPVVGGLQCALEIVEAVADAQSKRIASGGLR